MPRPRDAAGRVWPVGPRGRDVLDAVRAGYATAKRVAEYLGKRHTDACDGLRRLERAGYVARAGRRDAVWRLTPAGRRALRDYAVRGVEPGVPVRSTPGAASR